jgi:hypothetical protein
MADEYLFRYDLDEFKEDSLSSALQSIKKLTDEEVFELYKSEKLEVIIDEFYFEVATLASIPQKGKRRKEKSSYGRYNEFEEEFDVVDVFIPFQGSAESLTVKHPEGAEIDIPSRIEGNILIATFDDDEFLHQGVHEYIKCVTANLALLRTALKAFPAQIHKTIENAARERHEKLIRRRARDKDLGFPIE